MQVLSLMERRKLWDFKFLDQGKLAKTTSLPVNVFKMKFWWNSITPIESIFVGIFFSTLFVSVHYLVVSLPLWSNLTLWEFLMLFPVLLFFMSYFFCLTTLSDCLHQWMVWNEKRWAKVGGRRNEHLTFRLFSFKFFFQYVAFSIRCLLIKQITDKQARRDLKKFERHNSERTEYWKKGKFKRRFQTSNPNFDKFFFIMCEISDSHMRSRTELSCKVHRTK